MKIAIESIHELLDADPSPGPVVEHLVLDSAKHTLAGRIVSRASLLGHGPGEAGFLFHHFGNDSLAGYVQLFRSGVVEMCETVSDQPRPDQRGILSLSSNWLEKGFLAFVKESMSLLEELGVQPPVYVGISLLRVKGAFRDPSSADRG